jgi:hypothetical protein
VPTDAFVSPGPVQRDAVVKADVGAERTPGQRKQLRVGDEAGEVRVVLGGVALGLIASGGGDLRVNIGKRFGQSRARSGASRPGRSRWPSWSRRAFSSAFKMSPVKRIGTAVEKRGER